MLRLPAHLQISQHNVFYFRRSVPEDLRSILGQREIKRSLRTGDKREATRLARLLDFHIETIFQDARRAMSKHNKINPLELIVKGGRVNRNGDFLFDSLETDPAHPDAEARVIRELRSLVGKPAGSEAPSSAPSEADTPTLSDFVQAFCEEKRRENSWTQKSHQEAKAIYDLLIKILGDIRCGEFSREKARDIKNTLVKLPPQVNKAREFRGRSIKDIVADSPEKTMSITTVNKYLSRYSELFTWGKRNGYLTENFFEGLTFKNRVRNQDKRALFTNDDLQKLFDSPIYTKLEMAHSYYYWLPLLGLYTGARLNELCQLELSDIRKDDGIPVLDINDNGQGKRLKNGSSKRLVPLHSELLHLGLFEHVNVLKAKGQTRLFPELTQGRDGYGKNPSRWFNERFLVQQGVKSRTKVFHSFRHTVATTLKHHGISEGHAKAILGHDEESISYGHYGKQYTPADLQKSIEKIGFWDVIEKIAPYKKP